MEQALGNDEWKLADNMDDEQLYQYLKNLEFPAFDPLSRYSSAQEEHQKLSRGLNAPIA